MTNGAYVMRFIDFSSIPPRGKVIISPFHHPMTRRKTREFFLIGLRVCSVQTCTHIYNGISTKSGVSEL